MNDLLRERDFIKVGHTGGLHGYDGTVHLILDKAFESVAGKSIAFLYYLEDGMFVPRFIRAWNRGRSLASFERITARKEARKLTDQHVYLRKRDLPESFPVQENPDQQWNLLDGYQLWDVEKEVLMGVIESVEEYPGGWMAEVSQKGRSEPLLIPLAEPLIEGIDEKEKMLYMRLPEGLEEL